jgi:hypothetical protein
VGLGFKSWAAGDVLTASDVNGYLMDQAVQSFASAAARDTALTGELAEGMVAYLRDTDSLTVYNGSAWVPFGGVGSWTSYTPTLGGTGWAIGNGTAVGAYIKIGRFVSFRARITSGSTTTYGASNAPTISLPITAVTVPTDLNLRIFDSGTGSFIGIANLLNSTTLICYAMATGGSYASFAEITSTVPFTWATGDQLIVSGVYESAA